MHATNIDDEFQLWIQSFIPTYSRAEMIIQTSGHLQTHDTHVDLPINRRVLSVSLRAILALVVAHRIHEHGVVAPIQPARPGEWTKWCRDLLLLLLMMMLWREIIGVVWIPIPIPVSSRAAHGISRVDLNGKLALSPTGSAGSTGVLVLTGELLLWVLMVVCAWRFRVLVRV